MAHPDGWGIGAFIDGDPLVERSVSAAYHGEAFSDSAARIYAHTVIAHVRDATTGVVNEDNTHPFQRGRTLFAHNGTIEQLDRVREALLHEIAPGHRDSVRGTTDSELLFMVVLTLRDRYPDESRVEVLRRALRRVMHLCREAQCEASLNTLWTDGTFMVGSRLGRSLWSLTRRGVHDCEVCGFPHIRHHPDESYFAAVVASERLSDEDWQSVPEASVFSIEDDMSVRIEPIGGDAVRHRYSR